MFMFIYGILFVSYYGSFNILLAGIISPSYWKESPDITYKYVNIVDYDSNNKTFTYTQNEKKT